MKRFERLLVVVLLACVPMVAQVEARLKNKGDYQMSTKFPTEVGMTTMSILSFRDASSRLPTGKRMHKPFVITKEIDKASPLLYRAMASGQALPSMEIAYPGAVPVACDKNTARKVAGGKVSLQDISIMKIVKLSPTTEEITIEAGSTMVTAEGQEVDCGKAVAVSAK